MASSIDFRDYESPLRTAAARFRSPSAGSNTLFDVRPDLVAVDNKNNPRSYLADGGRPARFYVDSLVHDADALSLLVKLFGTARVALGSDYPFPLGEEHPGALIEAMNLSARDKEQLFSLTAREFLGLTP